MTIEIFEIRKAVFWKLMRKFDKCLLPMWGNCIWPGKEAEARYLKSLIQKASKRMVEAMDATKAA